MKTVSPPIHFADLVDKGLLNTRFYVVVRSIALKKFYIQTTSKVDIWFYVITAADDVAVMMDIYYYTTRFDTIEEFKGNQ